MLQRYYYLTDFCYWVKLIHLHVSTAEGAGTEKKTDLILYLGLWPLVWTKRSPHPPPSMAEIQGGYQPKWSLHLPPLCFGMKITASGIELQAKINIGPFFPFLPLPPSYFILTTTCHWIMGSGETITEALTSRISSSMYANEKHLSSPPPPPMPFITLIPRFNSFSFLFAFSYIYMCSLNYSPIPDFQEGNSNASNDAGFGCRNTESFTEGNENVQNVLSCNIFLNPTNYTIK